MRLFVSWSGGVVKEFAQELAQWLHGVIHQVRPFVSTDIGPGGRWSDEIATQLEKCNFGVVCLTRENIGSNWIQFEAGALSKMLGSSSVVPILLGGLRPTELPSTLTQFQAVTGKREDFFRLVNRLNECLGEDDQLDSTTLTKTFDLWWPSMEAKIREVDAELALAESATGQSPREPARSIDDIMSDILLLTQENSRTLQAVKEQVSSLPNVSLSVSDELVRTVMREERQLLGPLEKLGIVGLYTFRGEALVAFAPHIRAEIDRARMGKRARLWFVATSLKGYFYLGGPAFRARDLLHEAAAQPTLDLRIALLDPNQTALRGGQEHENTSEDISNDVHAAIHALKQLQVPIETVRLYSGSPTMFGIATSTHMLLNPYPYGEEAHKSFTFIVHNTPTDDDVYSQYEMAHFKHAWEDGASLPVSSDEASDETGKVAAASPRPKAPTQANRRQRASRLRPGDQ